MRHPSPSQSGFTLIEVMVGFVLVFVLMLGLNALWTQVGAQFDDLVYRQKAVFRLNGEMERLTAQYNDNSNVTFTSPSADTNAVLAVDYTLNIPADAGSFISTAPGASSLPAAIAPLTRKIYYWANAPVGSAPVGKPAFVLDSTVPTNMTTFTTPIPPADNGTAAGNTQVTQAIYNYILSFYNAVTPTTSRNVVWLDRSRNVVAQLSWDFFTLSNVNAASCLGGGCYLMTVYVDYPFRFDTTAGTYAPISGTPVETITAQTIVGKVLK